MQKADSKFRGQTFKSSSESGSIKTHFLLNRASSKHSTQTFIFLFLKQTKSKPIFTGIEQKQNTRHKHSNARYSYNINNKRQCVHLKRKKTKLGQKMDAQRD